MISFTEGMKTGISHIDLQHQELVHMINEMALAHESGQSTSALNTLLPRLAVYALFHFGEEEVLLAQVAEGTTFAELHLQEHRSFVEEIQRLSDSRSSQSDEELAEVIILYLADWLVLHISGTDLALAKLLHKKPTSKNYVGPL